MRQFVGVLHVLSPYANSETGKELADGKVSRLLLDFERHDGEEPWRRFKHLVALFRELFHVVSKEH